MIAQEIPGFGPIRLDHLVLDMNGTLAVEGELLPGVAERLRMLAEKIRIYVLTADTYGAARRIFGDLPVALTIIEDDDEAVAKEAFVTRLGASRAAAIGNGRNDARMLAKARLGIAVLEGEGCAAAAASSADILARTIQDALDLLLHPVRLKATLRA